MLKYLEDRTMVTFAEIPDEISLAISVTNCDGLCEGCHSPELRGDVGEPLSRDIMKLACDNYRLGITCVCFLGEGRKSKGWKGEFIKICTDLKLSLPKIKIALYSGHPEIDYDLMPYLDYYKVGPYIAALGPLDKKTTNQKLYKIEHKGPDFTYKDITYKFWRKEKLDE